VRAILTYHSIDSSGSPVSVSEQAFRAHVRFLGSGRVSVVPLADLPAMPDDKDAVALTFDDGFQNFATSGQPVLSEMGFPATIFVVADAVGGTNAWGGKEVPGIPTLPLMRWHELESAIDAGFEIGAHTRTHPDLTTLQASQLEDETAGSAERINAELGHRPVRFAYPYGAVNRAVASFVRENFEQGVTTELRPLRNAEDQALLPRLDAWYFRDAGQLEEWGSPAFRRRIWIRAQGRRVRTLVTAGGWAR
jgi:peptidoglycan/xylan/chitin deacetylase (PgdA/CDA1 family)